jgi:hypothetical protein
MARLIKEVLLEPLIQVSDTESISLVRVNFRSRR